MEKKKQIPSPTFCSLAFQQLHVSPVGVVKPCCIFEGAIKKDNGATLLFSDTDVSSIWNSAHLREIRTKMLKGETTPECAKCIAEEKLNGYSDRISSNAEAADWSRQIEEAAHKDGFVSELPKVLNLKLGNLCNLKCRMCQPIDSSQVDKEFYEISKKYPEFRAFDNASAFDYYYNELPVKELGSWPSHPTALKNLRQLVDSSDYIALAGGETTVTPEAIDLLEYCVQSGAASRLKINLSSNLTLLTERIYNLLTQFRKAEVTASIDGVGKAIEYIRYPSKWDKVLANYLKLLNGPANVLPILSPTVQVYNILNLDELLTFFEDLEGDRCDGIHLTLLHSPHFLSIRVLPENIRQIAYGRLKTYYDRSPLVKKLFAFRSRLELILNTLAEKSDEYHQNLLPIFLKYSEVLDEKRSQKLSESIPDLYELIQGMNVKARFPEGPEGKSFTFLKMRDLGFQFLKLEKYKEAESYFASAKELAPEDVENSFGLAVCYKQLGQFEKAALIFKDIYKSNPNHFYNLVELAHFERSKSNAAGALEYFHKARAVAPPGEKSNLDRYIFEAENT